MPIPSQVVEEGQMMPFSGGMEILWRGFSFKTGSTGLSLRPTFRLRLEYVPSGDYWHGLDERSEMACQMLSENYEDFIPPARLSDFLKTAVAAGWVIDI